MFEHEEAVNFVVALHAFGFSAHVQEQPGRSPAVWCEDAGLLFQEPADVKFWLVRTWRSEERQEVLNFG